MLAYRFFLLAASIAGLVTLGVAQQPCNPTTLPLQLGQLAVNHPIDNSCPCAGAPKGAAGSPIRSANDFQNAIKSNFQISTAQPKIITVRDMIRLQEKLDEFSFTELPRGDRFHLPSLAQRALLRGLSLGTNKMFNEGDLVVLTGFVLAAKHSNVESGESVNCDKSGCSNNDIHIEVTANPRDPDLDKGEQMNEEGVVAEISPRHRPAAWDTLDSLDYRNFFSHNPVTFIGQLFYDASHSPGGGPDRAAVWEVHPVYAIFVCRNTTLQACSINKLSDETVWLPFHKVKNVLNINVRARQTCVNNP
jgi:hypothetical protein